MLPFRIWCASSTITKSKKGAGSKSTKPCDRSRFSFSPSYTRESNAEYGTIILLSLRGHSPYISVSSTACLKSRPDNSSNSSSKRRISFSHLCSATSGFGQMMSIFSSSSCASSSLMIKPASIVLPTPTLSAIRIRGSSELIILSAGLN